jgi:hypothetical protein
LVAGLLLGLVAASFSGAATPTRPGRVLELHPSKVAGCDEEFVRVANSLQPGDRLVLRGGTYSQECRRRITGRHGTPDHPIVISSAPGETAILTRPLRPDHHYGQNNLEIEDSSYLTLHGLELHRGSTGIRFMGSNHHIVLEANEIHEVSNNAIAMNSGHTAHFIIRRNDIHHTGLLAQSVANTEGEGLYLGCHDGDCVAANHLIEGNYIHDLRGTSVGGNDGIEIKKGSHGNIVRHNVIHSTTIGTRYPCIFVYGGGPAVNVVEGNALWNCGEAVQVVADAIIRNNIIAASDIGITSGPHARMKDVRNVRIVNNTIYGHRVCLHLRWIGARDMVLANNAVYCPDAQAVDGTGLDGSSTVGRSNLVEGTMAGASVDGVRFVAGGGAAAAFREPLTLDFWPRPGSRLIGRAADSFAPETDFNGSLRGRPYDVGAYQVSGAFGNPGWRVRPGFKDLAARVGAVAF